MAKILESFDNFWKITEHGSNFKNEIMGGITTFMAMAYILVVNPSITSGCKQVGVESLYIGTCIGALVGTLMMALYAKLPFAQAPGMGLNAYFAYTVINMKFGEHLLTYGNALFIILISGIIFLLLTIFGIREKIVDSVPLCIKNSITAGIGLFIAFVGLQNSRIIRNDDSTLVGFAPMNAIDYPFEELWPTYLVMLNFLIICILCYHNVRGGMLWGILVGTVLHYIVGYCGGYIDPHDDKQLQKLATFLTKYDDPEPFPVNGVIGHYLQSASYLVDPSLTINIKDPITAFKDWGKESAFIVFRNGWKKLFQKSRWFKDLLNIIATVLAFAMVDMFDTIGTLLGTAKRAKLLNKEGKLPNMGQALLCDSVGTIAGTFCGVSTVTTFVESSAGVNEGARTGFASLITALCFFIALWLSPLSQIIPSTATTPALMYVGVLMISSITDLDFNDVSVAAPAFMTISFMAFSYNISIGIALGLLCHAFMKLVSAAIYGCKSLCCKNKQMEMSSADEKEQDREMDHISDNSISSQENNDNDENTENTENQLSIVDNSNEERYVSNRPKKVLSYKEKAISELKEISPVIAVIDVLFLIYFFCARK
ncbi:hypothetical protein M9Y10_021397 [Tritrichomonas musculus]|uniref:Permease n=1 Tax=Tritrichomonas musculus TaxID=1915356 RepID=A0ABR2HDU1_9EUKA